ncbi:hypothetical protein OJ996_17475 [Luteolibacter sp. GHJ8]|uniref:Uncharacterized protein n=1 Tax=Luteolibacter rhizosphaerae TaxID=2989719 RepID=A0ABT3G6A8_9BACT|nr:hypothetical protein [Luteolibacter rhizosphaerae]MCW1915379.1 hypothetical protein [Luteolibacter rhizosphaerae]
MKAPGKRILGIGLAVLVAFFVLVFLAVVLWRHQPAPHLPAFDSASLFRHDIALEGLVKQELPSADLGRLRSELEAADFDREPMKWVFVGQLELRQDGVKVLNITLFRGSGDFLPVQIGGHYYRLQSPGMLGELLKTKDLRSD